jgi:hypothetical protein
MQENWKVKNDSDAEYIIEKCNEDLMEINRFRLSLEEKLENIKFKLDKLKEEENSIIERRNSYLIEYFQTIDDKFKKKTKTMEKYRLPSGEIIKKYPGPEFKRDDEKLLNWVKSNEPEFVEVKETPKWGELKKITKVVGNSVVIESTGEIVEGVKVIERPPVMEFKEV